MLIFFDPASLAILHIVHQADPSFIDYQKTQSVHWIESDLDLPIKLIGLAQGADGTVSVYQKTVFDITMPPSMVVGQEAQITGIPAGTTISIDGQSKAIMDGTGVLEFTPTAAGVYPFKFEADRYLTLETSVEALPSA